MVLGAVVAGVKGLFGRRRNKGRERVDENGVPVDLDAFVPVTLQWRDVRSVLELKRGAESKRILDGVSGAAEPGRMLAIMGASGSGKTSLLNVLSGQTAAAKKLRLTGRVRVNGVRLGRSRHRQAYIRQEDVFYSQLTARETLLMEAKLRLPRGVSTEEKEALVEALITRLSLTSCADTPVGDNKTRGLSGGEKKRLSLGCELIGSPALIFADEPTTGLDSFQAEKVMGTLRALADSGHTVVCTIHQPRGSIFRMFDDLMLMSAGRVVYSGPAGDAVNAFVAEGLPSPDGENPAEYLIDQIAVDTSSPEAEAASRARIAALLASQGAPAAAGVSRMRASDSAKSLNEASASRHAPPAPRSSWWQQFRMLFKRAWRQVTRDKATAIARMASSVGSAVIFGTIFFRVGLTQAAVQSRMGLMQVAAINCAMSSLVKTLTLFPKERLIVQREQAKGSYHTTPYFLAKLAAELPVGSLFPLMFGALMYPLTGLHASFTRFAKFCGILVLESFTSQALGLTVGAVAPSVDFAMALGPMVMVIFIVFGGFYVNADTIPAPLRWLPNVSLIKWAFEALTINDFAGLKFETKRPTDAATGEEALERLGFAGRSLRGAVLGEARVLGAYYLLTWLLLRRNKAKYATVEEAGGDESRGSAADSAAASQSA